MQTKNDYQAGFTLIEILVVLGICSLVILPALYNWQQQLQHFRLTDAARQVSEFIYNNFMEGVYLNQHRVLSITMNQDSGRLVVSDAVTNKELGDHIVAGAGGVDISNATRTLVNLYGKQGTSSAFSLQLQNSYGKITIIVSAVGRIRVCSNQNIVGVPRC